MSGYLKDKKESAIRRARKSISGIGNSRCKGFEVGRGLMCPWTREEGGVTRD